MKKPIIPVLTVILFGLLITTPGSELQSPSVVEAYGYSARSPDKTISDLYREALADALKNAVIQAHTELNIEACTENMQLKTQTIHTRSRGYVKSSSPIDSGFLPDDPSIYRVHIKAIILPLPSGKMKDCEELTAGTNPTNSASLFCCSNCVTNITVSGSSNSSSNRLYSLQYRTTPGTGRWMPAEGPTNRNQKEK